MYRVAATDKLIELLKEPRQGLIPLCYHRLVADVKVTRSFMVASTNLSGLYSQTSGEPNEGRERP